MSQYRHELKYIVSQAQIPLLRTRVAALMQLDPHGNYNIRSVYFDDYDNTCYYENENGTDPREKFRIRIYNHSDTPIHLECKRKECGKTLKTTVGLTRDLTESVLGGGKMIGDTPLQRKFLLQQETRLLRPVVIVEYERIPYIYQNGNVRVTFDQNISSSMSVGDFFRAEIPRRPVMPTGYQLLEVKFDEYLPDFIYRALNLGNLQQTAFSKYYLCRKYKV